MIILCNQTKISINFRRRRKLNPNDKLMDFTVEQEETNQSVHSGTVQNYPSFSILFLPDSDD